MTDRIESIGMKENNMTDTRALRTAIVGLLRHAAMEEEMLIVSTSHRRHEGSAERWAPLPTIAHNTEFKRQQVQRLQSILREETPPTFTEVDHGSQPVYEVYAAVDLDVAAGESRRTANDLVESLLLVSDADLTDPARHPWLRGRPLWLQTIVRGFWHPLGHVGDWYIANALQERGVALRNNAVATAEYLNAPDASRGMAWYSLACTYAAIGTLDGAVEALEHAAKLNRDFRERIATDPDLQGLRTDYRVAALIG
jgi:hypothetical protein